MRIGIRIMGLVALCLGLGACSSSSPSGSGGGTSGGTSPTPGGPPTGIPTSPLPSSTVPPTTATCAGNVVAAASDAPSNAPQIRAGKTKLFIMTASGTPRAIDKPAGAGTTPDPRAMAGLTAGGTAYVFVDDVPWKLSYSSAWSFSDGTSTTATPATAIHDGTSTGSGPVALGLDGGYAYVSTDATATTIQRVKLEAGAAWEVYSTSAGAPLVATAAQSELAFGRGVLFASQKVAGATRIARLTLSGAPPADPVPIAYPDLGKFTTWGPAGSAVLFVGSDTLVSGACKAMEIDDEHGKVRSLTVPSVGFCAVDVLVDSAVYAASPTTLGRLDLTSGAAGPGTLCPVSALSMTEDETNVYWLTSTNQVMALAK